MKDNTPKCNKVFFYQDFNRRFPEIIKPVAYLSLCGENNQGL